MKTEGNLQWWLLALILLIAAILRIYNLDYSYSNDELSALSRLTFNSVQEVIVKGVMVDGHPAFVQLLLYFWTNLFGNTEVPVRLPFVIFGIGSVAMVYLVAKEWFHSNTALITASAMAGFQFFIMYSQLARPYSPGLFFTWSAVYYWTLILKGKGTYLNAVFGGVFIALAMYTHYFSFMQVMIMGGIGLFWLNRQNMVYYSIIGVVAVVLWIPHFTITMGHLGLGGVGSWLGPPEADFLWKFILTLFNDSFIMLILFMIFPIAGIWIHRSPMIFTRWHLVSLLLFFIPLIVGFIYSLMVNPVLQYSTLLFSTPCLFMFLCSFIKRELPSIAITSIVLAVLGITTLHTVVVAKYYHTEHFGVFRELTEKIVQWDDEYKAENITKIAHVNSPFYLEHYFNRLNHPAEFILYDIESDSSQVLLQKIIEESTTPYLAFVWSTHYVPLEIYEIIRSAYPTLADDEYHFNSGAYLFSKDGNDERPMHFSFDVRDTNRSQFLEGIDAEKIKSDSTGWRYRVNPMDEYTWSFSSTVKDLKLTGGELVVINTVIRTIPEAEVTLVLEYLSEEVKNKKWYGNDMFPVYSNQFSDVHELIMAFEVPSEPKPVDRLKTYLWKRSSDSLWIEQFSLKVYATVSNQ